MVVASGGHSPDVLMRTYAHVLPESVRTVTDKIGRRIQDHTDSAS